MPMKETEKEIELTMQITTAETRKTYSAKVLLRFLRNLDEIMVKMEIQMEIMGKKVAPAEKIQIVVRMELFLIFWCRAMARDVTVP